jgi:sugar O-acyltransferase (sialic acid O-acetyltransferase NeuD family)
MLHFKKDIILLGGGGHCKSVIDVIEKTEKYRIIGILDIDENVGKKVLDYTIIGTDKELQNLRKRINYAFITVGQISDYSLRVNLFNLAKNYNFILPVIISPLSYVSKYTRIDEGTIIMHHALVNAGAKIGRNCIINTKALIEHDAVIEDFCHISTGSIVNGGTVIGKYSFLGSNAVTKQYTKIEEKSFVKAGSVVK